MTGSGCVGFIDDQVSLSLDGSDDGIAVVAGSGVSFIAADSDGISLVSSSRRIDGDHNGALEAAARCQSSR